MQPQKRENKDLKEDRITSIPHPTPPSITESATELNTINSKKLIQSVTLELMDNKKFQILFLHCTRAAAVTSDHYQAVYRHLSNGQVPLNNVCVMSMRVPAAAATATAAWAGDHPVAGTGTPHQSRLQFTTTITLLQQAGTPGPWSMKETEKEQV